MSTPDSNPFAGATVSRSAGRLLYRQLADILVEAIESGRCPVGSALPSENELCRLFAVSRPVVRQALDVLSQERRVYRVHGKGTFVAERKLDSFLMQVGTGPERDTIRFRDRLRTRLLERALLVADLELSQRLQLNAGAAVVRLLRLRLLDGEPLCLLESYVSSALVPGLLERDLEDRSLYEVLETSFGITIADITRKIEAANLGEQDADRLRAKAGEAGLVVTSLATASNGAPLEWSRACYRGDRIALTTHFSPGAGAGA
jgi:GntR family transcriptional regulator